jgi:hypothetical protein
VAFCKKKIEDEAEILGRDAVIAKNRFSNPRRRMSLGADFSRIRFG